MSNVIGFKLFMRSRVTENHDGEYSNDPYRYRGTTDTEWYFERVERVDEYPDANLYLKDGEEFDENKQYYIIYAIYSTGDSFGHDNKKCCEPLLVCSDYNSAKKYADHFEHIKDDDTYEYSRKLVMENGEIQTFYIPWLGHFERLDYIEVMPFYVAKESVRIYRVTN